jgi:hypothetical protein
MNTGEIYLISNYCVYEQTNTTNPEQGLTVDNNLDIDEDDNQYVRHQTR